jgi:hypothetical protein
MENNFNLSLKKYVDANDSENANRVIMCEIGNSLASNRENFIEVLKAANIEVDNNTSDVTLVNEFCKNIPSNRKLLLGTAFLINHNNKSVGFDGEETIDDKATKDTYKSMYSYFGCSNFDDSSDTKVVVSEEFYNVAADPVSAIAMALGAGANLGSKITESKMKKRYGVSDTLAKQQEARSQILQSLISKKQEQGKSKLSKQNKIIIVSLAVAALVVVGIIVMRKKS